MLRSLAFAAIAGLVAAVPAQAQTGFDAAGQFTLSFKFGLPGEEKEKPRLGFRLGASNVPKANLDVQDPTLRGLNLQFDRTDYTAKTFAGVGVEFGEADKETIRLIDDAFSAKSLGFSDRPDVMADEIPRSAGYLDATQQQRVDEAWMLSLDRKSTYGWMSSPLDEVVRQSPEQ